MDARQTLTNFIPLIDQKLKEFWDQEIKENFGFNQKQKDLVKKILLHSREHNLRSAKRLRASFVYYAYLLGSSSVDERIWAPAISVELVHTALLMHDDVMDQDDLRRGLPTTHRFFENSDPHYGESMAINVGDILQAFGYQQLLNSRFPPKFVILATNKLLDGITLTGYGQSFDVSLQKFSTWDEDDVIKVHQAKTAIYTYENPLHIGAYLAGLDKSVLDILTQYSLDGGVAFQLQDDVLGVFGDTEKTGKSADSDLLQGKCTLLVLKTLKDGTPPQISALKNIWGKRQAIQIDIDQAKKAIIDSGSLDYSRKISKEYAAKAVATAGKLRNLKLNSQAIDFIEGIAEYMVNRDL